MSVRILVGDCRQTLATLPDASVQCVVTSPPYFGLRDYGHDGQIGLEDSPTGYVSEMVAVFREVRRVLRDDGTLWLNLGDSYYSQTKGSGGSNPETSPKQAWKGAENGQGFEPRRISAGNLPVKPKDLIGIPWRVAFALQADGWWLRQDIIWHKPNPMPESVTDRCTKAHEYVFLFTKSPRYFYDAAAIAEESTGVSGGGFSRAYANAQPSHGAMRLDRPADTGTRNARSVWSITTQPFKGAHFATMPPALAERCIRAGSRPGDTVLDPFGGAGTTGLVADRLQRHAILCELNPTYADIARDRLRGDAPLFADVARDVR